MTTLYYYHKDFLQHDTGLDHPESPDRLSHINAALKDEWLFLAADVPADITKNGYEQFRFYFHVNIDPVIRNERIHVDRSASKKLGGIRQTTVKWQGSSPKNKDERWKKYNISDWRIFQYAKGASTMKQYRQFEAKINLQESGLFLGSPFSAFIEIETDPLYENGKFKKRQYLGKLGKQKKPCG